MRQGNQYGQEVIYNSHSNANLLHSLCCKALMTHCNMQRQIEYRNGMVCTTMVNLGNILYFHNNIAMSMDFLTFDFRNFLSHGGFR